MSQHHYDGRDLDWSIVFSPGRKFRGTDGDDRIVGTDGPDVFHMGQGGADTVLAGEGKDTIYMGATLSADDRIDGGAATNTVVLKGDYSAGLVLESETLSNIFYLDLVGKFKYNINLPENMEFGPRVERLVISGATAKNFTINGSLANFSLNIEGSDGNDTLIAGRSQNYIHGNSGQDKMFGGTGVDFFYFSFVTDSLPGKSDIIENFDPDVDGIVLVVIDADPSKKGDQAFHLGTTPGHVGDVTLTYDAGSDMTLLSAFTDKDDQPDMVIQLTGNHTDLVPNVNLFL